MKLRMLLRRDLRGNPSTFNYDVITIMSYFIVRNVMMVVAMATKETDTPT